jgi:23S rRNA (cytidine1920-2'-O)/16S rRNA (cytidine1409-2'-O)-methyltransferase
LIKPQFEVGRLEANKHAGVIRDQEVRGRAINKVLSQVSGEGFIVVNHCDCQVPGPKGNVEHFVYALKPGPS